MVDFPAHDLMNTKLNSVFIKIAEISSNNKKFEIGGYVTKDWDVVPYESLHPHDQFYAPPVDFYLDIINKKNDILFCFHSHLESEDASESDLKFIKTYEIPSVIYIINSNTFLSVNKQYEEDRFSWNPQGFWQKTLLCES